MSESQIDWVATTTAQTGFPNPTKEQIEKVISQYGGFTKTLNETVTNGKKSYTENKERYFIFEGNGRFDSTNIIFRNTSKQKVIRI